MRKSGVLMIFGSILLLGLFIFPLWSIRLVAPQYPEGLGMNIHIDSIIGVNEFDLQNIDALNHYVGMKNIPTPKEMKEFTIFPIVVSFMSLIGILIGILLYFDKINSIFILLWLGLISVLGIAGMYDFNKWLTEYGGNLNPEAPIKLMDENGNLLTYKPPLIGHVKLLNFDVDSWPHLGAFLMFLGMILILVAYLSARKYKNIKHENN